MIDGYSVQEAASVLGVPEGRVWELLARGVLSGTPEGDSMRVYLKALPAPMSTAAPRGEPPRTNGNGGSHTNGGEASAFRELLTEFRNLTERYGQALLALGEARGEVAGLRSRVELLEARLDLRLPAASDASPVAWESPAAAPVALVAPAVTAPPLEQPAPSSAEPAAPTPSPVRRTTPTRKGRATPTRKGRATRSAVDGFAEALARAQDPTTAEVGEGQAAAEVASEPEAPAISPVDQAVAEPALEPEARAAEPEAVLPEVDVAPAEPEAVLPEVDVAPAEPEAVLPAVDVAPAEPEAVLPAVDVAPAEPEAVLAEPEAVAAEPEPAEPEPAQPTYSPTVVEPDWFADGDFAWLDAAELEASSQAHEADVAPAITGPEPAQEHAPEPSFEPPAESVSMEADTEADMAIESEFAVQPDLPPMPEPPPISELPPMPDLPPAAEAEFQTSPEPLEPVLAEPVLAEPVDRLEAAEEPEPIASAAPAEPTPVVREEEVMWLGVERAAASEMETASARWGAVPDPLAAREEPIQRNAWPTVDLAPTVTRAEPPLLAMTEEELARLARDEGWDEAEVAAIRAMIVPPVRRAVALPGSAELDDAMAALHAVPVEADSQGYAAREWTKPPRNTQSTRYDDWAFEVEPVAPPTPITEPISAPRRPASDPGWLRRRQGPAATAYRRLRRLFPG